MLDNDSVISLPTIQEKVDCTTNITVFYKINIEQINEMKVHKIMMIRVHYNGGIIDADLRKNNLNEKNFRFIFC